MGKNTNIIIGVVVVVIIAVGGFALLHKSKSASDAAMSSASQNQGSTPPAVNNAVLITKSDPGVGSFLADPSGKPLYTYGKDTAGVSNCAGDCLTEWPAYQATGSSSNLPAGVAVITRTDGQKQYTYNGMPLYYFPDDKNGKPTGNGKDGFAIAKPAAASSSSSSNTTGPTSPAPAPQPSSNYSSGKPY